MMCLLIYKDRGLTELGFGQHFILFGVKTGVKWPILVYFEGKRSQKIQNDE